MDNEHLLRLEALRLAIMNSCEPEDAPAIVERAKAFNAFLQGTEGTDGDAA